MGSRYLVRNLVCFLQCAYDALPYVDDRRCVYRVDGREGVQFLSGRVESVDGLLTRVVLLHEINTIIHCQR